MSATSASERRDNSFKEVERMSPELRQCVHEYGYAIVNQCRMAGVTSPRMIHQLVREIWEGARQPRQRRVKAGTLDWLLVQAGAEISAAQLVRVLRNNNLLIVPTDPTRDMIDASMAEVSGFCERMTKIEKHRRRLKAALNAAASHIAPPTPNDAA